MAGTAEVLQDSEIQSNTTSTTTTTTTTTHLFIITTTSCFVPTTDHQVGKNGRMSTRL
jgi:hypothetical protein